MTNIIAALFFILISIVMLGMDTAVIRHYANNSAMQSSVIVEAKELKEFAQAAYDYSESFNVPLSTTTLTVSNLQSYGLLSSTFPKTTPFGQSFTATYATDTCNQNVMDLEVYAAGNYNTNLLAKNGLSGSLGVLSLNSQVENELSSLNMSFVNAHNPCINGGPSFYIGQTLLNSDIINIYGGGTVQTPNTAPSVGTAIYIYAPNQWGYLVFTISNALMDEWASVAGTAVSVNWNNLTNWPELNVSGWGLSCPTGSTIITGTNSQSYNLYSTGDGDVFWTNGYCVPAYKSQVNSLVVQNQHNLPQVFNISPGQSFYGQFSVGGTDPANAYMYGGGYIVSTNTYNYLGSVNGINNNIYGVENYFQAYPPYNPIPNNQYPGANFIPLESLYNFFDSVGADIKVNGVIYQIVEWKYSLITGQGYSPTQAGMNECNNTDPGIPSGDVTCFPPNAEIWEAAIGTNLGTSIDNYGGGYYITENPANPNSYTGGIDYVPYNLGPVYTDGFTIPTPLIN